VQHNSHSHGTGDPARRLHDLFMDLVRVSGLLYPDRPVIGQTLSISQAFALHELDLHPAGALSQRDLAQRLHLEKSTVSRLVADLESRALIVRERDPANRRLYRLRITDEGRAAHARIGADHHEQYVAMTAALTPAERDALLMGLPALIRVLKETSGPPP
jgi:DNA-binding MarR family transcriptional regulator